MVKFLDRGGKLQVLSRGLQLLDEVCGAQEQHAVAGINKRVAEGGPLPPLRARTDGARRRVVARLLRAGMKPPLRLHCADASLFGPNSMCLPSF